jgi:hypothetical protein
MKPPLTKKNRFQDYIRHMKMKKTMKKYWILISLAIYCTVNMNAQVQVDAFLGVSPGSSQGSSSVLVNTHYPVDEFQFRLIQSKSQWFAGLKGKMALTVPFFVETGILYSQLTREFGMRFTYRTEELTGKSVNLSETQHLLSCPMNIGVSLGELDLMSGLTVTKMLTSSKSLSSIDGFQSECKGWRLGWQFGARYVVDRALVGVEFQSELQRVCQGMFVQGQSLELRHVPGQIVFTLQYRI